MYHLNHLWQLIYLGQLGVLYVLTINRKHDKSISYVKLDFGTKIKTQKTNFRIANFSNFAFVKLGIFNIKYPLFEEGNIAYNLPVSVSCTSFFFSLTLCNTEEALFNLINVLITKGKLPHAESKRDVKFNLGPS